MGGNVGIGTINPNEKLEVNGTVKAAAFVGDGSGLTNVTTDTDWMETGGDVYRQTGKVGIGTTSPDRKLSVIGPVRSSFNSAETEYVELHHGGGNGIINWAGVGNLDFRYQNATLASITQAGNVGVGTTDVKGHKLYVNGSIGHQPETRYYTIPGVAFTGRYDSTPYEKEASIFRNNHTTEGHQYFAPVNLPHGAHITDMTVGYLSRDSGGALSVSLSGRGLTGGGLGIAALNLPRGGGSWTTASVSVDATVDNYNYGYFVFLYLQNNGATNHQLVSNVRLTYTVERPLP
jgi:hypothetical protein